MNWGGGEERRANAQAHQSRQGPVSRGGIYQGPGDRLLHADCARAAAAYPRPPADAQALPKRSRRRVLLREELSEAPATLGRDRNRVERRQQPRHVLLPLPGPADARVAPPDPPPPIPPPPAPPPDPTP